MAWGVAALGPALRHDGGSGPSPLLGVSRRPRLVPPAWLVPPAVQVPPGLGPRDFLTISICGCKRCQPMALDTRVLVQGSSSFRPFPHPSSLRLLPLSCTPRWVKCVLVLWAWSLQAALRLVPLSCTLPKVSICAKWYQPIAQDTRINAVSRSRIDDGINSVDTNVPRLTTTAVCVQRGFYTVSAAPCPGPFVP